MEWTIKNRRLSVTFEEGDPLKVWRQKYVVPERDEIELDLDDEKYEKLRQLIIDAALPTFALRRLSALTDNIIVDKS